MRRAALALATALIAGCGTSGVQVSEQQAAAIKPGVSSEADVRAALGAPTGVSVVGGRRILVYSGAAYAMRPQSFIPIVGAFAGGADWRASMILVTVASDGIVSDVQFHRQEQGSATGLSAQPVEPVPHQPR